MSRATVTALLAATAVRIAGLFVGTGIPCRADECSYLFLASEILAGRGHGPFEGHLWAPGYPFFLAAHGVVGTDVADPAKVTQVMLSIATIAILATVATRLWNDRVGACTAWILALYPTLVAFTHYVWSETIFLFWFVGATALLLETRERLRNEASANGLALIAGCAWGLAVLVKPLPLYFTVFVVPWLARPATRQPVAAALAFVLGLGATVLPWSLHASQRWGRPVVVEATLGVNLWRGNNTSPPPSWDYGMFRPTAGDVPRCDAANPIEANDCDVQRAIARIAADPVQFMLRAGTKMADLWTPTSFLVRHLATQSYGPTPRPVRNAISAAAIASWICVALAALVGLAGRLPDESAGSRDFRLLVLAFLAYTCAVHALAFGTSRFRLPAVALIVPFAAIAVAHRTELAFTRSRALVLVLAIATLGALWLARLDPVRFAFGT